MLNLSGKERLQDAITYQRVIPWLERSFARRDTAEVNTTTTNVVYLQHDVTGLIGGDYYIHIPYVWSYDVANSDIIIEIVVDGAVVETHRMEPKDAGGGDGGTGSGTNQRYTGVFADVINLTPGDHSIIIRHRAQVAGVEATIYKAAIIMERWGDV